MSKVNAEQLIRRAEIALARALTAVEKLETLPQGKATAARLDSIEKRILKLESDLIEVSSSFD